MSSDDVILAETLDIRHSTAVYRATWPYAFYRPTLSHIFIHRKKR